MKILISCAKLMRSQPFESIEIESTQPLYRDHTLHLLEGMLNYSVEKLGELLDVSNSIAQKNALYYRRFLDIDRVEWPAVFAFQGAVYKQFMNQEELPKDYLNLLQEYLLIADPFYGLLRSLDCIRQHRMEGNIRLATIKNQTVFDSWKPLLTTFLIDEVKKNGGLLINLASNEMKSLFDWKKVCESVDVVTPVFKVCKNGKCRQIVMYTKMARGQMVKQIIEEMSASNCNSVEFLKKLNCNGFSFVESSRKKMEDELLYIR